MNLEKVFVLIGVKIFLFCLEKKIFSEKKMAVTLYFHMLCKIVLRNTSNFIQVLQFLYKAFL